MSLGFEAELGWVSLSKYSFDASCGCMPFLGGSYVKDLGGLADGEADKQQIFVANDPVESSYFSPVPLVRGVVEWGFPMLRAREPILELSTLPDLAFPVDVTVGKSARALDKLLDLVFAVAGGGSFPPNRATENLLGVVWTDRSIGFDSTQEFEPSLGMQVSFSVNLEAMGRRALGRREAPLPTPDSPSKDSIAVDRTISFIMTKLVDHIFPAVHRIPPSAIGFLLLALTTLATEAKSGPARELFKKKYMYLPRASIRSVAALLDSTTTEFLATHWEDVTRVTLKALDQSGFKKDFTFDRLEYNKVVHGIDGKHVAPLLETYDTDSRHLFLDTVGDALGAEHARSRLSKALHGAGWTKSIVHLWDLTQLPDSTRIAPWVRDDGVVRVVMEARWLGSIKGGRNKLLKQLRELGNQFAHLDVPATTTTISLTSPRESPTRGRSPTRSDLLTNLDPSSRSPSPIHLVFDDRQRSRSPSPTRLLSLDTPPDSRSPSPERKRSLLPTPWRGTRRDREDTELLIVPRRQRSPSPPQERILVSLDDSEEEKGEKGDEALLDV